MKTLLNYNKLICKAKIWKNVAILLFINNIK